MPISGNIPITGGQGIVPSASWVLIGEDGKRFVNVGQQGLSTPAIKLGCAETNSTVFTRTNAQWASDLDGLALAGVPPASTVSQGPIPIPGTQYFYVPGTAIDNEDRWSVFVRYRIVSDASIVVDGAVAYQWTLSGFALAGGLGLCWCFGANVVDGELFAVCYLDNGSPLFDSAPGAYLLKIPLAYGTNVVEDDISVWPTRRTYIESVLTAGYFLSTIYFNGCTILDYPTANTVMIVTYRSGASLPGSGSNLTTAGSEFLLVNHSSQSLGTLQSLQSALGQPWSDVGLGYAGTTTPNNFYNDYSGPSFTAEGEVIFGRVFQDEITVNRIRRFLYDAALGTFTAAGLYDTTISGAGEGASDLTCIAYRDGDAILIGRYNTGQWMIGEFDLPIVPVPVSEGGTPYFIERMDNRIWPTIEDAWCLDAALKYPMPEPDATLYVSSATGNQEISEYNVINGGSGYTSPIIQVIDLNPQGGTGATAVATVSSGVITSVAAFDLGSGYINPEVTVLDTTGVGAVVQPIITNYVQLLTSTSSFTASDVGSIIRVGGGRMEITTVSTVTSSIANIIAPITATLPNDPNNTPIPAESGQWTMTAPTTEFSNLDHLEGMTVAALADGGVVTDLVVTNGSVTLPVAATSIVVGLPFVAQLQTMYLDLGGGPTVQTRRKDVTQAVLRVENSRAPEIGLNQPDAAAQPGQAEIPWGVRPYTALTQIPFRTPNMPAGQPAPLVSADLDITNLFSTWDSKGQIAVQQSDPVPLAVTAITVWVRVGDSTGQ